MRLLNQLAERDSLTGIHNRCDFARAAAGIWAQAARERKPLALMMVDVDFFKGYNDRHGHPAGDRCLIEVGAILARHARRPLDVLARHGGEEFVVLFGYNAARKAREGVRAELAALELKQPADGSCASITISVGVALVLPEQGRSAHLRALVETADQALYVAKTGGRNQCVVRRLRVGHEQRAVGG